MSYTDSMLSVLWTILGLGWLAQAGRLLYMRRAAVPVLLDLGPSPRRFTMYAGASFMFLMAVLLYFQPTRHGPAQTFAFLSWGLFFLVAARGRVQVTASGVSLGNSFVPWRRVVSMEGSNLKVKRLGGSATLTLEIDEAQSKQLGQIVSSHLAAMQTGR